MAELNGPKFCVEPQPRGRVIDAQNNKNFDFCKILKMREIFFTKSANFFILAPGLT